MTVGDRIKESRKKERTVPKGIGTKKLNISQQMVAQLEKPFCDA